MYDPLNGLVYISNSGSCNETIIHGTAEVASVSVCPAFTQGRLGGPGVPACSADNGYVFVPNGNNGSVFNGTRFIETRSPDPGCFHAVFDDGNRLV